MVFPVIPMGPASDTHNKHSPKSARVVGRCYPQWVGAPKMGNSGVASYIILKVDSLQAADTILVKFFRYENLGPGFNTAVSCAITNHPFVHDCCCWHCQQCCGQKLTSELIAWITKISSG